MIKCLAKTGFLLFVCSLFSCEKMVHNSQKETYMNGQTFVDESKELACTLLEEWKVVGIWGVFTGSKWCLFEGSRYLFPDFKKVYRKWRHCKTPENEKCSLVDENKFFLCKEGKRIPMDPMTEDGLDPFIKKQKLEGVVGNSLRAEYQGWRQDENTCMTSMNWGSETNPIYIEFPSTTRQFELTFRNKGKEKFIVCKKLRKLILPEPHFLKEINDLGDPVNETEEDKCIEDKSSIDRSPKKPCIPELIEITIIASPLTNSSPDRSSKVCPQSPPIFQSPNHPLSFSLKNGYDGRNNNLLPVSNQVTFNLPILQNGYNAGQNGGYLDRTRSSFISNNYINSQRRFYNQMSSSIISYGRIQQINCNQTTTFKNKTAQQIVCKGDPALKLLKILEGVERTDWRGLISQEMHPKIIERWQEEWGKGLSNISGGLKLLHGFHRIQDCPKCQINLLKENFAARYLKVYTEYLLFVPPTCSKKKESFVGYNETSWVNS